MGKRGPKPVGEYADKTRVLSTRISDELRRTLEAAAAERAAATNRPQSLSAEIEHRLRRSFDYDRDIRNIFSDSATYAFMRSIAAVIDVTARQAGGFARKARKKPDVDWLSDPFVYDRAVNAAMLVMEALRPPGDPTRPRMAEEDGSPAGKLLTKSMEVFGEGFAWGPGFAAQLLRAVRDADGTFPLPSGRKGDDTDALARKIASDLGPIAKRLKGETSK